MGKIILYPDPALRKKCKAVDKWGEEEKRVVSDLKAALVESGQGVGLSSPQIGEEARIFIAQADFFCFCSNSCHDEHDQTIVVVNPGISKTYGGARSSVGLKLRPFGRSQTARAN